MAIGWLAVLQMVPWSEVIKNAPKVADGAKKLWDAVGKKPPAQGSPSDIAVSPLSPDAQAIATLHARLIAMEAATNDLHSQMLASSELIKTLAEQNAQLIQRIEVNRMRLVALASATAVASLLAVAGLALAFLR